jgi:uncharacterized protein
MERVPEWNSGVFRTSAWYFTTAGGATILYMLAFVWNEKKDLSNQRKHGVSSETAAGVFTDPDAVSYLDRIVDDEKRWHTIGLAGAIVILLVVHTVDEKDEEEIRIISARKATPSERNLYLPAQ